MTEIIATFKVNKIPEDMPRAEIEDVLIDIADRNGLELISWGTT